MNYRHAYHAGNFADVAKHAVLALLIERLKAKETAFRVIDTHAGTGRYLLTQGPATRTREWESGIGRLWQARLPEPLAGLLASYLSVVRDLNAGGRLRVYPGSPLLARRLLRGQDRLTAVELHPEDARTLAAEFDGDRQVRIVHLDGWLAVNAFVPPKERRGIVLVDPPYEQPGELSALFDHFARAHRRWPTGVYALWYPIKDRAGVAAFLERLRASGIPKLLAAELMIAESGPEERLDGAGLIIANPPWQSTKAIDALLAGLAPVLSGEAGARGGVTILTGETA
jgi:23S rRNA (adenine2030-N6)-methyltransferase